MFQSARTVAWINAFGLQDPATHDATRIEMQLGTVAAGAALDVVEAAGTVGTRPGCSPAIGRRACEARRQERENSDARRTCSGVGVTPVYNSNCSAACSAITSAPVMTV